MLSLDTGRVVSGACLPTVCTTTPNEIVVRYETRCQYYTFDLESILVRLPHIRPEPNPRRIDMQREPDSSYFISLLAYMHTYVRRHFLCGYLSLYHRRIARKLGCERRHGPLGEERRSPRKLGDVCPRRSPHGRFRISVTSDNREVGIS